MKKEEDRGQCSSQTINNIQTYQEQLLLQQMMQHQQQQNGDVLSCDNNARGLTFPEVSVSPILQPPPPWSLPPVHSFNTSETGPTWEPDPFWASPPLSPYSSLFNRRVPSLQFAYEGLSSDRHHLRIVSEPLRVGPPAQPGSAPFGLQAGLGKMTAQEIMDAKALAASKSHSEAERRRRERINNHLTKLRSLLPSNTKTDKASLLAEVIQHVKELKRQTSVIAETSAVPTESDELSLSVDNASEEEGRLVMRASLCCDDRSDLLADLIDALKALRLRTLKAEITTLGGRVRNVLFVTAEEDHQRHRRQQQQHCLSSVQEALRAVMDKNSATAGDDNANGTAKRQRTTTHTLSNSTINVLPHNTSFT